MTAFTEVLNLYLPGGGSLGIGGDDEVADIDRLNQNFQKIDAFAEGWGVPEKRNQQFYDLASVRTTLTGMKRGDTFQESDGEHRFWVFDGLNWVSNRMVLPLAATGPLPASSQTGITTPVDVQNMSITFSLDRKAVVRFFAVVNTYGTANGDVALLKLTNGTGIDVDRTVPASSSATITATTHVHSVLYETEVPAGTHTFKIKAGRSAGTGTITALSQAAAPNSFSAEWVKE